MSRNLAYDAQMNAKDVRTPRQDLEESIARMKKHCARNAYVGVPPGPRVLRLVAVKESVELAHGHK